MGRREVVALGLLAVAIAISAGFFVVGGNDSGGRASIPVVVPTEPVPTPTPLNRNITTPTNGANFPFVTERGWQIAYVSYAENNIPLPLHAQVTAGLELDLPSIPYPDLPAGTWGVDATASFSLPAGAYAFVLRHTCQVQVFIDGAEVAAQVGSPQPLQLRVDFQAKGNPVTIRVIAHSTGLPFVLRYAAPGTIFGP